MYSKYVRLNYYICYFVILTVSKRTPQAPDIVLNYSEIDLGVRQLINAK